MAIDHTLKRTFSKFLTEAHLLDAPEKFIGKRFLFAYEIHGQIGMLCGEIRGIEHSSAAGLHLFISCPDLDTYKLKSLFWNPDTASWNAIVETEGVELLGHYLQGGQGLAPNCIPGILEVLC